MVPEFTWRCDVCHRERPDDKIVVKHTPVQGLEASFPHTRFNLKHCNDNPECIEAVEEIKVWTPGRKK